ncbi:hypothetical protein D3C72_2470420 [compost metagenome]
MEIVFFTKSLGVISVDVDGIFIGIKIITRDIIRIGVNGGTCIPGCFQPLKQGHNNFLIVAIL